VNTMGKLIFFESNHSYEVDGIKLPSVTEICRFLHYEAAYADKESRDRAARRGTAVHEETALIDYGEEVEVENEILGYVQAWRAFKRDYHVDVIEIERVVFGNVYVDDKPHPLCGTLDRVVEIRGKRYILDIKTGSKINKLALQAQLSAYAYVYDDPTVQLLGVHLRKDGTYTVYSPVKKPRLVENLYELHLEERRANYGGDNWFNNNSDRQCARKSAGTELRGERRQRKRDAHAKRGLSETTEDETPVSLEERCGEDPDGVPTARRIHAVERPRYDRA
jgi:hypothetical protein